MAYALFSQEKDQVINWFDGFDRNKIVQTIKNHLKNNPCDTIEYCREYDKKDIKKYYGMKIIDFYGCNPNTKQPCKIVTKGNKEYYKPLS